MSEQDSRQSTNVGKKVGGRPKALTAERVIDLYELLATDGELLRIVAAAFTVDASPRAATVKALSSKPAGGIEVLTQVAAILQTIGDHEIKASMQIMGYEQSERVAVWKFITGLGWGEGKLPGEAMASSLQIFETLRSKLDERDRIIRAVEQLSK